MSTKEKTLENKVKNSIFRSLHNAQADIEFLILVTPTGVEREKLTAAQIHTTELLETLKRHLQ